MLLGSRIVVTSAHVATVVVFVAVDRLYSLRPALLGSAFDSFTCKPQCHTVWRAWDMLWKATGQYLLAFRCPLISLLVLSFRVEEAKIINMDYFPFCCHMLSLLVYIFSSTLESTGSMLWARRRRHLQAFFLVWGSWWFGPSFGFWETSSGAILHWI